ncbi:MAG: class II fructose-bisphosphate aldolase [Oscillospiraceae bacterium]|nr:class II fructose-bisphosphate aldolase [Oscillospiraceae bacterium]
MRLQSMGPMLADARSGGYAIGAFEFWSYDSAMAVVCAAKRLRVPAILQIGPFERDYLDGHANAAKVARMAAAETDLPVSLHLDHSNDYDDVMAALEAGYPSVMIDASSLPYEENVALTRRVVREAARYGATVEAELGSLEGSEGGAESGGQTLTEPSQAADFVGRTGIGVLAIAIGTAHGFYTRPPNIDVPRLREIAKAVPIPLVLHGGSGTPDAKVAECVSCGISKVNICTEFIAAFGKAYSAAQSEAGFKYNVNSLFRRGMEAASMLAESKMRLFLNGKRPY